MISALPKFSLQISSLLSPVSVTVLLHMLMIRFEPGSAPSQEDNGRSLTLPFARFPGDCSLKYMVFRKSRNPWRNAI
jgi:hypothetical protein